MTQASPFRRVLKAIEKKVDGEVQDYINQLVKANAQQAEITMADKVLRPYLTILEMQRYAEQDPEHSYEALIATMSVMTTELLLNTYSSLSQQADIYARANDVMNKYVRTVESVLKDSLPDAMPKPH